MTPTLERISAALGDRYRVERELGAGGMATVYLAEDLRHKRRVAVKVLRPELAAVLGAERFVQEITTTASLQHPHILPLFDSGTADGFLYYVMPYVEGETLRSKLDRETQLSVEEAVRIAADVADALDYAHRRGVIHRDIKPENILLHDGRPVVADFGIALAVSAAAGGRMTETGLSLGTPHYMSPEQATAEKEITARADVYSLGCVLYEMLTGNPPHVGASAQQIIVRIIADPPRPVTEIRKSVPANVAAAVTKALEKLPADRFASAAEFRKALLDPHFEYSSMGGVGAGVAGGVTGRGARRDWRDLSRMPARALFLSIGGLAGLLLALGGLIGRATGRPAETERPVAHFELPGIAHYARLFDMPLAISQDGSWIAYRRRTTSGTVLTVRHLSNPEERSFPGTRVFGSPFFSPDGEWIGFVAGGEIRKVSLGGRVVTRVTRLPEGVFGAAWGAGDTIVFAGSRGLYRVSADGGEAVRFAAADTTPGRRETFHAPAFLPDGRTVVFHVAREGSEMTLAVANPDGTVRLLGQPGTTPRWVEGGILAFLNLDGALVAAPFDDRRLRFRDTSRVVVDNVMFAPASGTGKFALSRTGTLVYLEGAGTPRLDAVVTDRDGRVVRRLPLPEGLTAWTPRFSPDGRRIALEAQARQAGTAWASNVWVFQADGRDGRQVTFDSASVSPEWTPDGRRLVFSTASRAGSVRGRQPGLAVVAAQGGSPEPVPLEPGGYRYPQVFPDGRRLLFQATGSGGSDIWMASLDGSEPARPILATPFLEGEPALSPDGRWLAYDSNESGALEVYLGRPEAGSPRWRVSTAGGSAPRWALGGRALYYLTTDSLVVVTVGGAGPEPEIGAPRPLFRYRQGVGGVNYDVHPDGQTFVLQIDPAMRDLEPIHVLLGAFDALRTRGRGR